MSELREVIGALQSEVEIETVVSELGAAGIERARDHCRVVRRAGAVLAATGGAAKPTPLATLASGDSVGGLAALFGHTTKRTSTNGAVFNGGIVLIVHPATAEQFEHCGTDVLPSPSLLTHHRH